MLEKDGQDSARDLLRLPAVLVIVLIEVQMGTGPWRVIYPVLAVSLLSPYAQKLWAAILVARVLLMAAPGWPPLDELLSYNFSIVRTLFIWIMLAQSRLLASNRPVQLLSGVLSPRARTLSGLLIAAVIAIVLYVIFFNVPRPHANLLCAGFLVYVVRRIPPVSQGQRTRATIRRAEAGLVIASTLICLVLFELAARFLIPAGEVVRGRMYRPHPRAIFCLAENGRSVHTQDEFSITYVISDQGFRDRHYGKKEEVTYRILCVGDSFAMGHGVYLEETYAKVLESLLNERNLTKRIEVINAGTGGHGVWQELIMLEERGLALEPDLVILALHPQTDIRDALGQVGKVMISYDTLFQEYVRNWRRRIRPRPARVLSRWSRGFAFAYGRWTQVRGWAQLRLRKRFRRGEPPFPSPDRERPWWMETCLSAYYPELEEGWELLEDSVSRMADCCRERRIAILAFAMPASQEVYPGEVEQLMRDFGLDPALYDLDKTSRLARELCERNAIDFVAILDRFRQVRDSGDHLYYVQDGHITARGHRLCAQILYEHLLKRHLRELLPDSGDGTET